MINFVHGIFLPFKIFCRLPNDKFDGVMRLSEYIKINNTSKPLKTLGFYCRLSNFEMP